MGHDLRGVGGLGRRRLLRVDFHLVALGNLALDLLFLLELLVRLALDVDAALVRELAILGHTVLAVLLNAGHGGVLACDFTVGGLDSTLNSLFFLFVGFFGAVVFLITGEVGLGLLGRELGGGRRFGVPGKRMLDVFSRRRTGFEDFRTT